ncbi:MAG: hypothetical protein A2138_18040 [Deltaproteobacteria bacterium RBG_16_71_12]|nr:MAG: hypothetical protein A2138_18040 [Deltaproteobacteria bacterium RBG_16_71_12]
MLLAPLLPSCTCQRSENVDAKKRMSEPPPPDPSVRAASEQLAIDDLTDAKVLDRVMRMEGGEIAARLKSFAFTAEGNLTFGRGEQPAMRSAEKTRVVQGLARADGSDGDFAVEVVTGDGSEQRLAYVNEIFFLKNNNGKWRMSRDPDGERHAYRSDGLAVWKSFYDLFKHALTVEKIGDGRQDGREVVKYRLTVPDRGAQARAMGAKEPPLPVGPDGGPAEEPAEVTRKRMRDRMAKWRERAKPAGGAGELWIDVETAVPSYLRFDGKLVVGDAPDPAQLAVKLEQRFSEIGKNHQVPMPKDAIEEVRRQKMPVRVREMLEEGGAVEPLPRDAGPGGAASKVGATKGGASTGSAASGGGKQQSKPGELPDDPPDEAPVGPGNDPE